MIRGHEVALVALGSNLGESRAIVEAAIAELAGWCAAGAMVRSSLWRSEPWQAPAGSPDFVNAVVALPLEGLGSPWQLLDRLQEMERRYGRSPGGERNSARTLDLDILTFGDLQMTDQVLTIPHPRARDRLFVLRPLAEIAAQLRLPGESRRVSELIEEAPDLAMEKLGSG